MNRKRTVAAFDFDGTISYHDTLLPFLIFVKGYVKTFFLLFLASPYLLAFMCKIISRKRAKEQVVTLFFKNIPLNELRTFGRRFAEEKIPSLLRPEVLCQIAEHLKKNEECILISASLEVYLEPWAKSIGFSKVLATRLKTDGRGLITGKILGENCWGPEKVVRLEEYAGERDKYILYAYGNSRGDRELLDYSDFPFYCGKPVVK